MDSEHGPARWTKEFRSSWRAAAWTEPRQNENVLKLGTPWTARVRREYRVSPPWSAWRSVADSSPPGARGDAPVAGIRRNAMDYAHGSRIGPKKSIRSRAAWRRPWAVATNSRNQSNRAWPGVQFSRVQREFLDSADTGGLAVGFRSSPRRTRRDVHVVGIRRQIAATTSLMRGTPGRRNRAHPKTIGLSEDSSRPETRS